MMYKEMKPENSISVSYALSGRREYAEKTDFNGQRLPFELIISVKRGNADISVGDKVYSSSEGDAVFVPYNTEYKISAEKGSVLSYVAFEARIFIVLRIFSLFEYPLFYTGEASHTLFLAIEQIADMCAENDFTNKRLENAVKTVSLIYFIVSQLIESGVPIKTSESVAEAFSSLSEVLSYIGTHLSENIMQETLAGIAGLTQDAFYREFKTKIGVSPKDYIVSERLRRARAMLALTSLTVGEVSKAVGYENQFYFSGLFHKKYGISPTEYKRSVTSII
ncbi:MAG: AraC family transcriptional regulator [Eubacteriales bacterium]